MDAVAPHVDPAGVVFDVGANIGYFTLLLARKVRFKGYAFLFEPVPHLARLCRKTFSRSPFAATVFEYGLSDCDEERDLMISGSGNLGWNTLVAEKASSDMAPVQARFKAYTSVALDVKPSFIKIDVEGAEYKVLTGMMPALRTWTPLPTILCEIAWGASHPAWQEEITVLKNVRRLGYTVTDLEGVPVALDTLTETSDLLFVPRKG
ncbi:MAG: FkbM family methyltransferase [Chitinivibrionales bacterium]|nr:FkbM family methyltransferase [Chitinivibrionales bacterium]MBD3394043.1 FkbM family methyltransferase [Chitinivibrionales bacterium]